MAPASTSRPEAPLYSHAQTLRWLELVDNDPWWQHQQPVTRSALAFACGYMEKGSVGRAKSLGIAALGKISRLIPEIEARRLCFFRPPSAERFIWIDPPPVRHVERLTSAWDLSAICAACGCNKFLPVNIRGDDKSYAACYSCMPPGQYPAIGAGLLNFSLIHQALKTYDQTVTLPPQGTSNARAP